MWRLILKHWYVEYLSGSCDVYYEPDLSSFPGCLGAKSVHKRDVKTQYCSIMNLNPDAVLLPLDTCFGTAIGGSKYFSVTDVDRAF